MWLCKNVKDISNEHHLSKSPCDLKSPFYKMLKYNPWILLMNTKSTVVLTYTAVKNKWHQIYTEESPIEIKLRLVLKKFNYKCLKHKLLKRNYYKARFADINNQITLNYFQ